MCGFDDDIFLDYCQGHQRVKILGGFTYAMQEARFSWKPWLRQQSEMLSHNMWLHPFETTTGETLPLTRMGSLHYFYLDNTEHTEQKGITLLCIERTRANGCNRNTMSHSTTSHRGILPCTGRKEMNRHPQTLMYLFLFLPTGERNPPQPP